MNDLTKYHYIEGETSYIVRFDPVDGLFHKYAVVPFATSGLASGALNGTLKDQMQEYHDLRTDRGTPNAGAVAYIETVLTDSDVVPSTSVGGGMVLKSTSRDASQSVVNQTLIANVDMAATYGKLRDAYIFKSQQPPTPPTPSGLLTFTARENGTFGVHFNNVSSSVCQGIDYSTDNGGTWQTITNDGNSHPTLLSLNQGETVTWKGPNNTRYNGVTFTSSGTFDVSGDIMSLLTGFDSGTAVLTRDCFRDLFNSSNVTDASQLVLPATTLATYCYRGMFFNCTSLTSAPALPATTLVDSCYATMFSDCTSLTSAPALPATTLADYCYGAMFSGCTSLTSAPALPVTTLANSCYNSMFSGCTSLTSAPTLPATTLADSCYNSMFLGCSSLTSAPALPATTLADHCYNGMFWGCTSLTSAPTLPATTLADSCYATMFFGCSSLNYIKALFLDDPTVSPYDYTNNWVSGVSSTGTFVKNINATWPNTEGTYAIPAGWTVQYDTPPTPSCIGVFTINSNGDTVGFAPGNLQYNAVLNIWKTADNQWDYIGQDNSNIDSSYNGYIDLFGYGCNGEDNGQNVYEPYSTSTIDSDYYQNDLSGSSDWGYVWNQQTGESGWRILTDSEWDYIINTRSGDRYAKGIIDGQYNCLILFPDGYSTTLNDVNTSNAAFSTNSLTIADANALTSDGCVILPCGGSRFNTSVSRDNDNGCYWTSKRNTGESGNGSLSLRFAIHSIAIPAVNYLCDGLAIRLVQDIT